MNSSNSIKTNWISVLFFLIVSFNFLFANTKSNSLYSPHIIKIDDIKNKNYSHFGHIFSYAPGITIREFGIPGQPTTFRYRGSFDQQHAILLDGMPLLEPWSQTFDPTLIPVEMIDAIEIYPSINPFGSHAIGGTINLISREVPLEKPYTQFFYRTGSHQFSQLDVTFGQRILPNLSIISGALLEKYAETSPDSSYKSQKLRSMIKYRPFPFIDVSYQIISQQASNNTFYQLPMPLDTLWTNRRVEQKRYDHTFKSQVTFSKIKTNISYRYSSHTYKFSDSDTSKSFPIQSSSLCFQQMIDSTFLPIQWGVNYSKRLISLPDNIHLLDDYVNAYIQLHHTLPLKMNTLIQFHTHYTPNEKSHTFIDGKLSKLIHGRARGWISLNHGLRQPSLGERYGVPSYLMPPSENHAVWLLTQLGQILPNTDLKPETSQNMEIGFSYSWKNYFNLSLMGYHRQNQQLIQSVETPNGIQYNNMPGKPVFKGLEAFMQTRVSALEANGTLLYLNAEDSNDEQLPERPTISGNAEVAWNQDFFKGDIKLRVSLGMRFWSQFWSLNYDVLTETVTTIDHQPGFILNVKIAATIIENADVFLGIDNITQTNIAWISTYYIPKNTMRLGFTWRLVD